MCFLLTVASNTNAPIQRERGSERDRERVKVKKKKPNELETCRIKFADPISTYKNYV